MKKSGIIILLLAVVVLIFFLSKEDSKVPDEKGISVSSALGNIPEAGFERADRHREFIFPDDHGPHESFRTEWWYFTGNLQTPDGKLFGYQFTIFRTALSSSQNIRSSEWAADDIYMGHFAISDISSGKHYSSERFSRGDDQLAGAYSNPLKVWLEDWRIEGEYPSANFKMPVFSVISSCDNFSIDIELIPVKPLVLQGENGLSRKGVQEGNSSYYYSYTRLETSGTLTIEGEKYVVSGLSWMDREWSTSALDTNQVGWDWFSLQLDNGMDIMYYQIRDKDGNPDEFSKGSVILPDGTKIGINSEQIELEVISDWLSPEGVSYPSEWRFEIPSMEIELRLKPFFNEQEMDLSVKYWEGAINVLGNYAEIQVRGKGYVELTGYADRR